MKSWRTTLFGAGGLTSVLVPALNALLDGDPATVPNWEAVIPVAIMAIGLFFARDNKVTSESVGAK